MYPTNVITLPTKAERFYKDVLRVLNKANARFLIGGSLALAHYMHLPRKPKDLDIFIKRDDCDEVLAALEQNGYKTEVLHSHWLAKAYKDEYFIDFIFSSGNGMAQVDDDWFAYARPSKLLGSKVLISAPEELLWSKAFIMDRERFDGADIAHLLHDAADQIDWNRVLERFAEHWQVLLTHLLLFHYIYPSQKHLIPQQLMADLMVRAQNEVLGRIGPHAQVCNGTLLSRDQYLSDVDRLGYGDGRAAPYGRMTQDDIDEYTEQIKADAEKKAQAFLEEQRKRMEDAA